MEATQNEALRMEGLLAIAQERLAQEAEIEAGRMARLTLTNREGEKKTFMLPFRVAAYARKAMGAPALLPDVLQVMFTSRGVTVRLRPTVAGYVALVEALLAHLTGEQRRDRRRVRQIEAKLKKGGAAL